MKKIILIVVICLMASFAVVTAEQTGAPNSDLTATKQGQDSAANASNQATGNGSGEAVQTNVATQQENQGEAIPVQNQVQVQSRIKSGNYTTESGEPIQVKAQANNRIQLMSNRVSAGTSMQISQEQTQEKTMLKAKLSNGANAEIKVMPDKASEKAMERLRMKVCSEENNCQIELKEVGEGEQVRAAYEVQAQKQARLLGLFKTKMQVHAQVDAESGEVIMSKKPWWAFLASESEE